VEGGILSGAHCPGAAAADRHTLRQKAAAAITRRSRPVWNKRAMSKWYIFRMNLRPFSLALALCVSSACSSAPPRTTTTPGKAGIQWVSFPGGSFKMSLKGALPPRRVRVKPFEMARSAVTNGQYRDCVKAGSCTPARDYGPAFSGDDQPVVGVTWHQADAFSRWAGGHLPSEAQWEYAARSGGRNQEFPWGDEPATCERAVIPDREEGALPGLRTGFGCGRQAPWPVCSKPKGNTAQGLCDMGGNVHQWVRDASHKDYRGAPSDGSARETPGDHHPRRVIRGWPFDGSDTTSNAFSRDNQLPDTETDFIGFRPAR